MDIVLTKDADKMVCALYKDYLSRVKSGMSKSSSRKFSEDYFETSNFFLVWHKDDIKMSFNELKRNKFVTENIIGEFVLSDSFITYMENRFKNGLSEVIDFVSKFIP